MTEGRGGGKMVLVAMLMIFAGCTGDPTVPRTATQGPCVFANGQWVCQAPEGYGRTAVAATPTKTAILSQQTEVCCLISFETILCNPAWTSCGYVRPKVASPFAIGAVTNTLTGYENPVPCVPWMEYQGVDEYGNQVPFAWHTCWHVTVNGKAGRGLIWGG